MDVLSIVRQFRIEGVPEQAVPFGGGHINDTFKVEMQTPGHPGYLLQRINHEVFPEVAKLMENIRAVTEHLKIKGGEQAVLTIIPANNGELFIRNNDGYWRLFEFIEEGQSLEKAETPEQAYEAAFAFGKFMSNLVDYPVEQLHTTIPDFHDVSKRLIQFRVALREADPERGRKARPHILFVNENYEPVEKIWIDASEGEMPLRVTHNDTKFNNLLFNNEGKAVAVIDLDTVMPGYAFFDVGDALRTGVVTADEDETDLDKVVIDQAKYEAYLKGYLKATESILTEKERASLNHAGAYMAFIMGLRFLTDYLKGDVYYKTKYPEHNLDRAICQLQLYRQFSHLSIDSR